MRHHSETTGLNFGLRICHLHYFVCVQTVKTLADVNYVMGAKILCADRFTLYWSIFISNA